MHAVDPQKDQNSIMEACNVSCSRNTLKYTAAYKTTALIAVRILLQISTNTTIHHSTNTATADACIHDFLYSTALVMQSEANRC